MARFRRQLPQLPADAGQVPVRGVHGLHQGEQPRFHLIGNQAGLARAAVQLDPFGHDKELEAPGIGAAKVGRRGKAEAAIGRPAEHPRGVTPVLVGPHVPDCRAIARDADHAIAMR